MGFDKFYRKIVMKGGSAVYGLKVYSESLTPVGVASNSTIEQNFSITGLAITDKVLAFTPPVLGSGSPIGVTARVSATDTLTVTFVNPTGSTATPVTGTYKVVVLRAISGDEI